MKRLIKSSTDIFGMSVPRAKAIDILKAYSETLAYHLVKCVVYGDELGQDNFKHWVEDEICEYLSIANDVLTKPKNRKLKEKDYLDTIFADIGTTKQDANIVIRRFRIENKRKQSYPDFIVSPELIDNVFKTFQNTIAYMLPILTSSNNLNASDLVVGVYNAIQR